MPSVGLCRIAAGLPDSRALPGVRLGIVRCLLRHSAAKETACVPSFLASFPGTQTGPLAVHFDALVARLLREGHSSSSKWCNLSVFKDFNAWLARNHIRVEALDEVTVERYWEFRVRHRSTVPADRPSLSRILAVLREADVIAPKRLVEVSRDEQLIERFQRYLSRHGGHSRRSVLAHAPTLRCFLGHCCPGGASTAALSELTAEDITRFVTRHATKQSTKTTQHACWTLRSFLRFLRYEDVIAVDLASSVPSVRSWRFSSLPRFLSPSQVTQVLVAADRASPIGRRNYAVLMLLARLGLRASEVATLCLDDIDWRSSQLTIRSKGGSGTACLCQAT